MRKKAKKGAVSRSPCPIACSLDIIGDRWTLLLVRDLYFGRSRFKELAQSPERPPTNILTERLNRLVSSALVEKIASPDGTKHLAYRLTEKGQALAPTLDALRAWGLDWLPGTEAKIQRE